MNHIQGFLLIQIETDSDQRVSKYINVYLSGGILCQDKDQSSELNLAYPVIIYITKCTLLTKQNIVRSQIGKNHLLVYAWKCLTTNFLSDYIGANVETGRREQVEMRGDRVFQPQMADNYIDGSIIFNLLLFDIELLLQNI